MSETDHYGIGELYPYGSTESTLGLVSSDTTQLLPLMAATQKLYPRGTVKRIVKAQSNRTVSKNADILVRAESPLR